MIEIFDEISERIKVYLAVETVEDPYEKNKNLTYLNSIPIDAVVVDFSGAQIVYKLPGIETDKAYELTVESKHLGLLQQSYKINVRDDDCEGWKINGKMFIKKLDSNFMRILVYRKKI
jgi:hypothetical protein